jgi:hypothetical protein
VGLVNPVEHGGRGRAKHGETGTSLMGLMIRCSHVVAATITGIVFTDKRIAASGTTRAGDPSRAAAPWDRRGSGDSAWHPVTT